MSIEESKALARRFYEAFSLATMDEVLVPEYVHHDPSLPAEMQNGREAYKQITAMFLSAMPDLRNIVEDQIAEGDKVVSRWTTTGTHRGELMGIPATGKTVAVSGIAIHRIAGGKIAEGWIVFDALGLLQQLGAVPLPG